jgi:hypothetical protein
MKRHYTVSPKPYVWRLSDVPDGFYERTTPGTVDGPMTYDEYMKFVDEVLKVKFAAPNFIVRSPGDSEDVTITVPADAFKDFTWEICVLPRIDVDTTVEKE